MKFKLKSLFFLFVLTFTNLFAQNTITILHTNDLHAQLTPLKATWIKQTPQPLIGGIAALAQTIDQHKSESTLLLDAGDILTGTLISRMEYQGVTGGALIVMMNKMGYKASVVGNHDFDNGRQTLEKLMNLADFDILSANLFLGDSLFAPKPYQIYKRGDVRIGVIGLTISPILGLVPSTSLDSVRSQPLAQIAQKYIDEIDPITDLIVLLTHQGAGPDSVLATQIHHADVIVGGHSHTRLDKPKVVNGMLIVQAGSRARYLGELNLTVAGDSVQAYRGSLIPVWADSVNPNSEMSKMVQSFSSQIDAAFGDTIAILDHELSHDRFKPDISSVGIWVTNILQRSLNSDIAIVNTGGLRKNLQPGPITQKDIYELLPFINYLVEFECSGEDIQRMILKYEKAMHHNNYESIQFSGIQYQSEAVADSIQLSNITIDKQPLELSKTYKGISIDYVIIENPIRYLGFKPIKIQILKGKTMADFIIQQLKNNPNLVE